MRHIEYPARTGRRGGYQHTRYPRAQETAKATASASQGMGCWQMPSLCSTSLLKPIRNFFGSGFVSAGKISLLTQQQQAFCEGSMGLSLLSPQGQTQRPRSPPATEESKPRSSVLPVWRAGLLARAPAPASTLPPPRHAWGPSSLPFSFPGTQTPHTLSFCQRDGGKELGTFGEHSK